MGVDILGVFAEFETNLRRGRQMEGVKAEKVRGIYTGRKPTIKSEDVRRLRNDGLGATAIAKKLGVGRVRLQGAQRQDGDQRGFHSASGRSGKSITNSVPG